jgi:protein-S-isoprenylcysteine O-methyltransferase Ste14
MLSRALIFAINNDFHSFDSVTFFGNFLKPIFFATYLFLSSSKNKKLDLGAALGLIISFSVFQYLEISHEQLSPLLRYVAGVCFLYYVVVFLIALRNLGRSFTIIPTFTAIKSNGMYSIIRHPLYSSYMHFAFVFILLNPTYKNFIVLALAFVGMFLRSKSEEKFLNDEDPSYNEKMSSKPRYFHVYISTPVFVLMAIMIWLKVSG